ncbi:MAG: putative electron transfer oxidoreductase [Rhodospirillales bacterium]|nr:putative electron transfer oxidoreductase [Rhodospirillales bacterium]
MVDTVPPVRRAGSRVTRGAADALVVGGGLAGGALATALAEAGCSVVLLEREADPHNKVCGEFLSREAILYLEALGIDLPALGACHIHSVRLASAGDVVTVRLPFPALSLSRRALDHALLNRAAEAGAEIKRGTRVQSLEPRPLESCQDGWEARLAVGESVRGRAAFLATGKHDLRGFARPAGWQSDLIGFKMHLRLSPAQTALLAGHVELSLFRGGYAGLEPVEGGLANLCLLVRRKRYAALGQQWAALLDAMGADCPSLAERIHGAQPCWGRPLAISSIPYGYVRRRGDALWRLGDQAAVIPSFAGDGMSIALHSARLAAAYFLKGSTAIAYQRRMARDIIMPVRCATALSIASVHPLGRGLISWGASRLPGIMSLVAGATRVPAAALRRTGLDLA